MEPLGDNTAVSIGLVVTVLGAVLGVTAWFAKTLFAKIMEHSNKQFEVVAGTLNAMAEEFKEIKEDVRTVRDGLAEQARTQAVDEERFSSMLARLIAVEEAQKEINKEILGLVRDISEMRLKQEIGKPIKRVSR